MTRQLDSNTDHLGFIRQIDDYETQQDYVHLLFRIAQVELSEEPDDGWRASWPFPPSNHSRPWIPAKTGYLNKLESVGIVQRETVSNSTSVYRLNIPIEELAEELRSYTDHLDETDPTRDLEL
jgi:hypothetical protein